MRRRRAWREDSEVRRARRAARRRRQLARRHPPLRGIPARHRGDPGRHPSRGEHAAAPGAEALRARRRRGLPEGRGAEPDGVVQGPRHDGRDLQSARGGRAGRRLRVDRATPRLPPPPMRPAPGWPASSSSRRATSRSASSPRRSSMAPRSSRCEATSTPRSSSCANCRPAAPDRRRQLRQPVPDRGPEDGRLRDRRRARRRARRPLHPGRQRRQHHGVLARLPRVPRGGEVDPAAPDAGFPSRRRGADRRSATRIEKPETVATAIRIGNPASWTGATGGRANPAAPIARGDRRADPRRLPLPRRGGVGLLRARLGSLGRRPPEIGRPGGFQVVCVLTGNGLKDPDVAIGGARPPDVVDATLDSVLEALAL